MCPKDSRIEGRKLTRDLGRSNHATESADTRHGASEIDVSFVSITF